MHGAGKIQVATPQAAFLCSQHSVSPFLTLYPFTGLVIAWNLRDTSVSHKMMTCVNIIMGKKSYH